MYRSLYVALDDVGGHRRRAWCRVRGGDERDRSVRARPQVSRGRDRGRIARWNRARPRRHLRRGARGRRAARGSNPPGRSPAVIPSGLARRPRAATRSGRRRAIGFASPRDRRTAARSGRRARRCAAVRSRPRVQYGRRPCGSAVRSLELDSTSIRSAATRRLSRRRALVGPRDGRMLHASGGGPAVRLHRAATGDLQPESVHRRAAGPSRKSPRCRARRSAWASIS